MSLELGPVDVRFSIVHKKYDKGLVIEIIVVFGNQFLKCLESRL